MKDIGRLEKENKYNKLQCKELKCKHDRLECRCEQFIRLCENEKSVRNIGCLKTWTKHDSKHVFNLKE